jgi:hypothetical protein
MADDQIIEAPPPSTIDQHGRDLLLERLVDYHGDRRPDIAPQLLQAPRRRSLPMRASIAA